jgi:putative membrane protein
MLLSEADHQRIDAAVAAAERATSGEIFCIVTDEVSEYREVPLAWAAGAALLLPPLALLLGFRPDALLDVFTGGWDAAHGSAAQAVTRTLFTYVALQTAVFVLTALLVSVPAVRRRLTPKSLKRERVHKAALEQFLAKGLHLTRERTGVLVFAALDDHWIEVLADEGVASKVDGHVWGEAVRAAVERLKSGDAGGGFVRAVELCGAVLAEHFPSSQDNPNELPDRLVEI